MFRPLSFPRLHQEREQETTLETALREISNAVSTVEKQHGILLQDCLHCQIIRGESPATIVQEWPMVLAIKALTPINENHVLLLPKIHVNDYTTRPDMSALVMKAAAEYAPTPSSMWTTAHSTNQHFHLHILPRTENDHTTFPDETPQHPR